jgi:hypothetical protein
LQRHRKAILLCNIRPSQKNEILKVERAKEGPGIEKVEEIERRVGVRLRKARSQPYDIGTYN